MSTICSRNFKIISHFTAAQTYFILLLILHTFHPPLAKTLISFILEVCVCVYPLDVVAAGVAWHGTPRTQKSPTPLHPPRREDLISLGSVVVPRKVGHNVWLSRRCVRWRVTGFPPYSRLERCTLWPSLMTGSRDSNLLHIGVRSRSRMKQQYNKC